MKYINVYIELNVLYGYKYADCVAIMIIVHQAIVRKVFGVQDNVLFFFLTLGQSSVLTKYVNPIVEHLVLCLQRLSLIRCITDLLFSQL